MIGFWTSPRCRRRTRPDPCPGQGGDRGSHRDICSSCFSGCRCQWPIQSWAVVIGLSHAPGCRSYSDFFASQLVPCHWLANFAQQISEAGLAENPANFFFQVHESIVASSANLLLSTQQRQFDLR